MIALHHTVQPRVRIGKDVLYIKLSLSSDGNQEMAYCIVHWAGSLDVFGFFFLIIKII